MINLPSPGLQSVTPTPHFRFVNGRHAPLASTHTEPRCRYITTYRNHVNRSRQNRFRRAGQSAALQMTLQLPYLSPSDITLSGRCN